MGVAQIHHIVVLGVAVYWICVKVITIVDLKYFHAVTIIVDYTYLRTPMHQ